MISRSFEDVQWNNAGVSQTSLFIKSKSGCVSFRYGSGLKRRLRAMWSIFWYGHYTVDEVNDDEITFHVPLKVKLHERYMTESHHPERVLCDLIEASRALPHLKIAQLIQGAMSLSDGNDLMSIDDTELSRHLNTFKFNQQAYESQLRSQFDSDLVERKSRILSPPPPVIPLATDKALDEDACLEHGIQKST